MREVQRAILGPRNRERDYDLLASSSGLALSEAEQDLLHNFMLEARATKPPAGRMAAFFPLTARRDASWGLALIDVQKQDEHTMVFADVLIFPRTMLDESGVGWAVHRVLMDAPPRPEWTTRRDAPTVRFEPSFFSGDRATESGRHLGSIMSAARATTIVVEPGLDLVRAAHDVFEQLPPHHRADRSFSSSPLLPWQSLAGGRGGFDVVFSQGVANPNQIGFGRNGLAIPGEMLRTWQASLDDLDAILSRQTRARPGGYVRGAADFASALRAVFAKHRTVGVRDLLEAAAQIAPADNRQRALGEALDEELERRLPRTAIDAAADIDVYWRLRPRFGEVSPAFVTRLALAHRALFLLTPATLDGLRADFLRPQNVKAASHLMQVAPVDVANLITMAKHVARGLLNENCEVSRDFLLNTLKTIVSLPETDRRFVGELSELARVLIVSGHTAPLAREVDRWSGFGETSANHVRYCLSAVAAAANDMMDAGARLPGKKGALLDLHLALRHANHELQRSRLAI